MALRWNGGSVQKSPTDTLRGPMEETLLESLELIVLTSRFGSDDSDEFFSRSASVF